MPPLSHPQSFSGRSEGESTARLSSPESTTVRIQTSPPVVLSIAGFDPSAGAGVLADLKTFAAIGVYGMACITAYTVQSTQGVRRVSDPNPDIVIETLDCLAADVCFSAIKVGMLGNAPVARAVAGWLVQRPEISVVLDPVLKSSSGKDLLDSAGLEVLRSSWLARAHWITPNREELAALTARPIPKVAEETEEAAQCLQQMAERQGNSGIRIVVTGGDAKVPNDLLLADKKCRWFLGEHIETNSTHGTGCTFSSALAARLALGDEPTMAVQTAKGFVAGALQHAYPVGRGKGPVNHFWKKT